MKLYQLPNGDIAPIGVSTPKEIGDTEDGWVINTPTSPSPPKDALVEALFRDGYKSMTPKVATDYYWHHADQGGDIMAYRIIDAPKSECPAWTPPLAHLAAQEGWALTDNQIHRIGSDTSFDAVAFVYKLADAGSYIHTIAAAHHTETKTFDVKLSRAEIESIVGFGPDVALCDRLKALLPA